MQHNKLSRRRVMAGTAGISAGQAALLAASVNADPFAPDDEIPAFGIDGQPEIIAE